MLLIFLKKNHQMLGLNTLLKNFYQQVLNVLFVVKITLKKNQISWTFGSILVSLGEQL